MQLVTAFSRDSGEDKVYVQHRMEEQEVGERLCDLILDKGASFLLAGNSKNMPGQVREALGSRLGREQAEAYVERMEREGRYQTETWS